MFRNRGYVTRAYQDGTHEAGDAGDEIAFADEEVRDVQISPPEASQHWPTAISPGSVQQALATGPGVRNASVGVTALLLMPFSLAPSPDRLRGRRHHRLQPRAKHQDQASLRQAANGNAPRPVSSV